MDEFEKLLQELKAAIDKAGTGSQSRRDIVKKDLDNLKKSNSLTTKELQQRNKALQAARELVKGNEKLTEQIDDRIKAGEKVIKANLELKENPPSRSAKLRCLIKKENFYDFKTDILDKFKDLIEIENLGLNL